MSSQKSYDRIPNFMGGMDAYRYAAELDPNQSQLLQNLLVLDNGRAVTRPGADQIDSASPSFATNVTPVGAVQGMGFLDTLSTKLLLMAQGGNLYTWNGSTWSTALAFTLTSASAQMEVVQGIDKLLISDGVQHMRLWDGTAFSDLGAAGNTNAPIGATILSYIAGMFVAAGPGMVAGAGPTTYPADTLFFSNYLEAGSGKWNITQSFRVGNGDGEAIVAMTPIQTTDATYPIYKLAVLKENSIWIVNLQPGAYYSATNNTSALAYSAMFAALSQTAQGDQVGTGVGCVGKHAWCIFQNDLLFMSQDGVQSLQRMQAAAGQYQLTSPLSTPIQPYIDRINWTYAKNIQAIKYRQLSIFFVPLDNSTTNNYALVWNGRIGQWMIWTGWNPTAICITRFAGSQGSINTIQLIIGNSNGSVNQWKDAQSLFGVDSTYKDNGVDIPCTIKTRALVFGNLDFQKKANAVLVRFNQGNATVNLSAYFDLADEDDWAKDVVPTGTVLPVVLPFVLGSLKPVECYQRLEGLTYANEIYLQISTTKGWFDIRNIVMSAFLKTLRDPKA